MRESEPAARLLAEGVRLVLAAIAGRRRLRHRRSVAISANAFHERPSVIVNDIGMPSRFRKPHRHHAPRRHQRVRAGPRARSSCAAVSCATARSARPGPPGLVRPVQVIRRVLRGWCRWRAIGRRRLAAHRAEQQIVGPRIRHDRGRQGHRDDRGRAPETDDVVPVEVAGACGRRRPERQNRPRVLHAPRLRATTNRDRSRRSAARNARLLAPVERFREPAILGGQSDPAVPVLDRSEEGLRGRGSFTEDRA